jgi:hypothetical protein
MENDGLSADESKKYWQYVLFVLNMVAYNLNVIILKLECVVCCFTGSVDPLKAMTVSRADLIAINPFILLAINTLFFFTNMLKKLLPFIRRAVLRNMHGKLLMVQLA